MSELRSDRRILRASDADRERAVDFLRRHAAEGRLDIDELSDRVGKALSAKTLGELDDITYDLPADAPVLAVPTPMRPPGVGGGVVLARMALIYLLLFLAFFTSHGARYTAFVVVALCLLVLRLGRRVGGRGRRSRSAAWRSERPFGPPY